MKSDTRKMYLKVLEIVWKTSPVCLEYIGNFVLDLISQILMLTVKACDST